MELGFYMNLSVKYFAKKFFNKYFWKMHPEAALRYAKVVSEIKIANIKNAKILEVGCGSLGIIPYYKKNIDGIDINFSGPQTKLLNKINSTLILNFFKKYLDFRTVFIAYQSPIKIL